MRDRSDSQWSLATSSENRFGMPPSVASSVVYSPENVYTFVHSPAYSDVSPQGPPAQEFGAVPATVEQINSASTSSAAAAVTVTSPLSRASGNEAVIQQLVQYMLDGYDAPSINCDELNNNCVSSTQTATTATTTTTTVVNGH